MKSLKAFVTPLAVPFAIVAGIGAAVAATVTIQDVNLKVAQLTAPFNTTNSAMNFAFTSLNIDAEKTLDFGFKGFIARRGTANEIKFDIKKFEYAFGDGTKPTVDVDLRVDFDLVKAFGQDTINELAKSLDQIVVDAAKGVNDYGPSAQVAAVIEDKVVDAQGNVESVKLKVSASVDLKQLPATKPVDDVEFQSVDVVFTAGRMGMTAEVKFVANPLYKGFAKQGSGLKEYIEKILADDQQTYTELSTYLAMADGLLARVVEFKP